MREVGSKKRKRDSVCVCVCAGEVAEAFDRAKGRNIEKQKEGGMKKESRT